MDLWVKLDKFWKKKEDFLFVFKGYTCRFKSEAFASFASIALRPCTNNVQHSEVAQSAWSKEDFVSVILNINHFYR